MTELFFNKLVTKSLQPILGNERFFEGYLTVEVKDKQGEVTIVDELIKVLPIWMDRGAPITDTHSNRVIGKGINYQKTIYKAVDGSEYPAIKIIGKIHNDYELDNEIWSRITSGDYKGLSFGGATKTGRTPFRMKDGSIAYQLRDLEHYEVAVCKDPAVPLALITDFNPLAKAIANESSMHSEGKMLIRCTNFGCSITKEDFSVEKSDDVIKANLAQYPTFEKKVQALIEEGYSEASAKKIVGSFVKGEKNAAMDNSPKLNNSQRGLGSDPSVQTEDSQQITEKKEESQQEKDKNEEKNEKEEEIEKEKKPDFKKKAKIEEYKSTAKYINGLIKGLLVTW